MVVAIRHCAGARARVLEVIDLEASPEMGPGAPLSSPSSPATEAAPHAPPELGTGAAASEERQAPVSDRPPAPTAPGNSHQ